MIKFEIRKCGASSCLRLLWLCRVFCGSIWIFSEFSSVLSHVWLFVTPWTAIHQASLSITHSRSMLKLMSIESVMPYSHLILCHPVPLPPIFPSIRVFFNESGLRIRWPKYWSFSISPPNEYSGSISFRIEVLLFANYCHRNWASAVNKINGALFSWTSQPSKKTTNKLTKAKDSDCDSCWQGNEQDKMRKEKRR